MDINDYLDGVFGDVDDELFALIRLQPGGECSVNVIQNVLGDRGLLRAGVLTATGKIKVVSGGGIEPYILTINE